MRIASVKPTDRASSSVTDTRHQPNARIPQPFFELDMGYAHLSGRLPSRVRDTVGKAIQNPRVYLENYRYGKRLLGRSDRIRLESEGKIGRLFSADSVRVLRNFNGGRIPRIGTVRSPPIHAR
jgi:hypothetical protein